jgi:hypothetical protein
MNALRIPIGTLIYDLSEQGIKLSVRRGNLTVDAPKGRVTSNVLGVLKERKSEIVQEFEGMDEEIQFGKTASLYRGAKLPNRGYLGEATKLYQKRGWVQIFSGHLNQSIYLVRNKWVIVPDPTLSKYTQDEIESLKGLSWEEAQTLHKAKVLFKGEIL